MRGHRCNKIQGRVLYQLDEGANELDLVLYDLSARTGEHGNDTLYADDARICIYCRQTGQPQTHINKAGEPSPSNGGKCSQTCSGATGQPPSRVFDIARSSTMVLANVAARPFSPSAPAEPPRDPVSIETILELDFDGLFCFSAAILPQDIPKFYPKAKFYPKMRRAGFSTQKKALG